MEGILLSIENASMAEATALSSPQSTLPPINVWSDIQLWQSSPATTGNTNNDTEINGSAPYFGDEFYQFKQTYLIWHGYMSLVVCVFGIMANALNIIVLTRKDMASATNSILTGMAVADLLVIGSYIPFAVHNYLPGNELPELMFTYGWSIFTLFHAHFTIIFHTISIWLTVLLAVWRYLTVSSPTNGKAWCSIKRAKWAIGLTYLIVPIVCLPAYLTFTIKRFTIEGCNYPLYKVDFRRVSARRGEILQKLNFWVLAIFSKVFPCILLTYLSVALIRVLFEAKKRKLRLKKQDENLWMQSSTRRGSSVSRRGSPLVIKIKNKLDSEMHNSDRTSKMLIAILLTFIVCELPSGTLTIMSGIFGEVFFTHVYVNLGEVMDMLALISCVSNFVLYCTMSRQFRKTFKRIFWSNAVLQDFLYERRKSLQSIIYGAQSTGFTEQTGV